MKKIFLLIAFVALTCSAFAQRQMREVFAQLPDSVLPLLTKNNRLDCIDFIENDMEARVKNKFDESVILEALTPDYLFIRTSKSSYVEMKLVPHGADTLVCVNRTHLGPAEDSEVRLYNLRWEFRGNMSRPAVKDFFRNAESIQPWKAEMADTMRMIRSQAEFLPLIKASLSKDKNEVTWELQTQEFDKDTKKVADKYLQPVISKL